MLKPVENRAFLWYNSYRKSCHASLCGCRLPALAHGCGIDDLAKMPLQAFLHRGIIIKILI